MPTETQVTQLVQTLTRATILGALQWKIGQLPPELARGTSDIVDDFFVTNYKGQDIAVYERKYRAYDGDRDESFWSSDAKLAILPKSGAIWDTPGDSGEFGPYSKWLGILPQILIASSTSFLNSFYARERLRVVAKTHL